MFFAKWAIFCANVMKIKDFRTLLKKLSFKQTPCMTAFMAKLYKKGMKYINLKKLCE